MAAKSGERLADRLLSLLDGPGGARLTAQIEALSRETGVQAGSELVRLVAHLSCGEEEARAILGDSGRHREDLRARLGRDVGGRIALFDLLVGLQKRLSNPKIIELPAFERIERSAVTDGLTGTFNRAYFDSRLQLEVRRARRYGQHLSVLMLDLDDFKSINDSRGHSAGDLVLREVGRVLVRKVRDIDIAARYGGEEFAVILPETRRSGAYVVAERIRSEVQKHFRRRGALERAARVTLSGGLACYPEDAEDPQSLVARADQALYRAKDSGKNAIVIYFQEKRRDERYPLEERRVKATLEAEAGAGPHRQSGRVKNISEGGLLVEISEPLPVGSEIQVSFSLGRDQDYTLPSRVVRLEDHGRNGKRRRFEAGIRFQRRARSLQPRLNRLARDQAAAG